ncbi:MAG: DMT family transporter [Chloroflexota bacterium]|nr:DMT family transporter [Chloroflexota bacterium]MDE2884012.1 DMT family transporter [Chloroflexota bacterium]
MILGALIALASSFSFAVNSILVRRGITGAGATAAQGAFISVLLGVPLGLVAVLATGQLFRFGQFALDGYLLLAGAGVVHFVIGRYCYYRAIGAIGAPRTVTIQTIAVPYSIVMAMLLLGERPTLPMYVGIALILGSPALMIERPKRPASVARDRPSVPGGGGTRQVSAAPAVELHMVEGYVFSLLSSVAYGTSPILIRAAMEGATDAAAVGTFIAYVGAAAVLIVSLALPAQRHLVGTISVRYLRIFGGAGLSVFTAQLLRFFALSLAGVSVVNPLMRTVSIFTLILSYVINRRLEHITPGVVLGVLVSFAGSALLVYAAAVA